MLARVVAGVHSPTESSSPLLPLIQPTRHVKKYLLLRWPSRSAFLVATLSAIAASLLIYDLSSFFSRHSSDQGQAYFTNPLGWYEAGGGSLMPVDSTSGPVVRPIAQESNSSAISDWPSYPTIDPFLLELHEMISGTKGFYVRDYSLGLGWNNVRYQIEAALVQARVLNRTAVIPSFVYARACEYDIIVCADYAEMINRNDAIGIDEWKDLPLTEQMGWRVPMTEMLNITRLRKYQPVVLVEEFLRLHNLSASTEQNNGAWDRFVYHTGTYLFGEYPGRHPALFVIENNWLDPGEVHRVDKIPAHLKNSEHWDPEGGNRDKAQVGGWKDLDVSPIAAKLGAAIRDGKRLLEWKTAKWTLADDLQAVDPTMSDAALKTMLEDNGWHLMYTFSSPMGLDYSKVVVEPTVQVAPLPFLRGFEDDFGSLDQEVVLLVGETHLDRKPGNIRFMTKEARDDFTRLVLRGIHPTQKVTDLADRIAERMTEINQGRLWMGAHMRRGDFVKLGWAMENSPSQHLDRLKRFLREGRIILQRLNVGNIMTYDVPDVEIDNSVLLRKAPQENYKFYLATDERNPESLDYFTKHGAVLIYDVLTKEDRREFGWPLFLTDVVSLVEQAVLARGGYFVGHAMSSVSGGIVNLRAAHGVDPRTTKLD